VFGDEGKGEELLRIVPRKTWNVSDVVDGVTGEKMGALRRKEWVPFARDQWTVLDAGDREIGFMREESVALTSLARWDPYLIPRRFYGEMEGARVCTLRQRFNPFVIKMDLDFSEDFRGLLDRRLGIAAGVLVCAFGRRG
jgi:hypothetical protein